MSSCAGARFAHPFHFGEVGQPGAHDLLQVGEAVDDVVGDDLGQARDLMQQAEAARLQRAVDPDTRIQAEHARDRVRVEQDVVFEGGHSRRPDLVFAVDLKMNSVWDFQAFEG